MKQINLEKVISEFSKSSVDNQIECYYKLGEYLKDVINSQQEQLKTQIQILEKNKENIKTPNNN